jgi:hypothetical protein
MRLYDYAASGNCYKVRLLFALLGTPYERVAIDIFAGDTERVTRSVRRGTSEGAENSLMRFVVYVPSGASTAPSRELRPHAAVSDSAAVGQRG